MSSAAIERKPERKSYFFHHPGADNYMKFWKKDDRLGQSSCALIDLLARKCGARAEMESVTYRQGGRPRYAWALEVEPDREVEPLPDMKSCSLPAQDFLKLHFPELPYFTQGTNVTVNAAVRQWFRQNPERQEDAAGPVYDHWSEENGYTVWMPLV